MDSSRSAVRELSHPPETGTSACLELVFGSKSGSTVIRHSYAEAPFKITRLYCPENSSLAQLIIMNTTPGLFAGDNTAISIRVEDGARILITSQASTRVHPGKGIAEQAFHIEVEPGGELHLYNDPLIPYRSSRLRQRTNIKLSANSRLFFWDGFMAGRVSRGETWQFEELDNETRLVRDGRLIYLERYKIDSQSCPRGFHYVATGIFHEQFKTSLLDGHAANVGIDEPAPGLAMSWFEWDQSTDRA